MSDSITPMMAQYRRIKAQLPPDVILFFRLGDFYEMFQDDAREVAPLLNIALTRRNGVPMCGVPYHSVDSYLARLIRAGRRVAICDQTEDPALARGIVRRDVTRIVSPGSVIEDNMLESARHNFLAGVCRCGDRIGIALLELSTGFFAVEEASDAAFAAEEMRKAGPAEIVVPEGQRGDGCIAGILEAVKPAAVVSGDDWTFEIDAARSFLTAHFKVHSLEGFGCGDLDAAVCAAGGALYYSKETLRRSAAQVKSLRLLRSADFLALDQSTLANLDLLPAPGRPREGTLLAVLDTTRTAMGARRMREWIARPLASRQKIEERLQAVEALTGDRTLLARLRDQLGRLRDFERLIGRIAAGGGNARDLVALAESLDALPDTKQLAESADSPLLAGLARSIACQPELVRLIASAIVDEPPAGVRDGGMIRSGFSPELDELRKIAAEGRQWLAEYQAREQQRTGIKTLKVRHNKVFGYYIEISKGQAALAPPDYERKQTLTTGERFITTELKEYESRITGAQDKAIALEHEIFQQVRQAAAEKTAEIQAAADAVASIDALASFAERASALGYVKPAMSDGDRLLIRGGRHPVVEQTLQAERFVPNDTHLDCGENQIMILTGPNMAGKSTYIRQVGLIVVMAHMGSFVPADSAEICVVDRVFTRVGAGDDLSRGRSTFLVEMQETANILNNATPRSLVILDEIGRGTSTFDGISIAWAVAEYLHNNPSVKAKTLFATHYHELTDLALTLKGVKNYTVQVRESGGRIVFLRKIVPGGSDKSYGIHVARLAGLPDEVIERAREILANLEEGEMNETGQPKIARRRRRTPKDDSRQMRLF